MSDKGYTINILREGSHLRTPEGLTKRSCNIVLIQGPVGFAIVNPGSPWDGPSLLTALKSVGVSDPEEIKYVICTDGSAEHVGCLSLFQGAELMIVGHDIQKRNGLFIQHDFGDGIAPYEFDENFYVIGTPGQRIQQVSVMVRGRIVSIPAGAHSAECIAEQTPSVLAITGNLFADKLDASRVSFFDSLDVGHGDGMNDKENALNSWRRSREYILERASWIVPAYGPPFQVQPEYSLTPCVELA